MLKRTMSFLLAVTIFASLICVGYSGNREEIVVFAKAEPAPEIRAVSVPSISAPFTTHPTVFMVEDTYQIAFATDATGISWVEINGVKYEDADNGLMNWNSKYHKITVPQSALNDALSYKICFRPLADRPSYDPVPGSTVSRTYPFDPVPVDRDPVFYCSSDQHGTNDNNLKVSTYKDFDVYVFAGDYITALHEDAQLKLLLDMTGAVTQGRKPTIYARGNHEIRGSLCYDLDRVSGYSDTTGSYYRVELPGIFALVMDAGEDKADKHSTYSDTVTFTEHRKRQTEWLREIVNSREWEKYPVRMVFCHVPFTYYTDEEFDGVYSEWTELLDQMGISLVISGHSHKNEIQGPYGTAHTTNPNFTVLICSDRANGKYTYSGSFVTVSDSEYTVQTVLHNMTLKSTNTIPVFTNAYVREETKAVSESAKALGTEIDAAPESTVTVPTVASPYTLHPTVFAVEDTYQIIFTTDVTGMAWAEVGGKKYTDSTTGLMNWASTYHKVIVPRVALDTARSYTLCFQSMTTRETYYSTHGSTVSHTYPFIPIGDKREPVLLCLSDFCGLDAEAQTVAQYKTFDALYVGGDYAYNGNTEENIKTLLTTCSAVTNGTKPVIYTRGNREVRGANSDLLEQAAPHSEKTGSYFTVEQNNLFAIVLDSGEDKPDKDVAYGATVAYEKYRKEQTEWLKKVVASGVWKDYPTRVAFCHMPFTMNATAAFKADYAEWTELLDQMGISLLISGNNYTSDVYGPDDAAHVSDPSFSVVTVSDVDNDTYAYSGSFITFGADQFRIESVSSAGKLLRTTDVSNLTAADYWKNSDPYLMFDYNNDALAQERYHDSVYGGINFDVKTNWTAETNTGTPTISRGVLSFSPLDATVTSSGVYSGAQGNVKGNWAYSALHYMTKATDYCQIRFKIDDAVSSATDGNGIFRLDVDCLNDIDASADTTKYYTRFQKSFKVADVVGKGYTTLTFPLNTTEYLNFDWMNLVHPQFVNIKSASGKTAVFSIDYIYIGPQASLPQQDNYLFFDFTDTEADRQRYDNFTYNYLNFDDPSNWSAYTGSPMVSISDGAMRLAVTPQNVDGSYSARSRGGTVSMMHYVPGANDYLKVRIKINNAVATTTDGTVTFRMNLDRTNTLVNASGTSRTWTNLPINFKLADYVDKGYFTLELPLTDEEYLKSDWINLVHPQFLNMKSADGKNAEFFIDYIYIGPEERMPRDSFDVTFCNENGAILETVAVEKGSAAIYSGAAPTKAYDATNHYTFAGWDKDITDITSDLIVTAQFTATAHSISYTSTNAYSHKESCACGYTVSAAHTYTDGTCVCGVVKDLYLDTDLVFYSKRLDLQSYIGVNFIVHNAVAADYDRIFVSVKREDGTVTVLSGKSFGSAYTYFSFRMAAPDMTENLTVTLFAIKDGMIYHGEMANWSVRDGIMEQINGIGDLTNETNRKWMTLMVDMLNYGAATQLLFDMRTDDLANNKLTDEQLAYGTPEVPNISASLRETANSGATVKFLKKTLSLQSSIELQFLISLGGYALEELEARITVNGTTVKVAPESYLGSYGMIIYDGIAAKDLRTPVEITVYHRTTGKAVSNTVLGSIEALAATMLPDEADIVYAMMRYGDAAEQVYG